jgi:hypothetical protein
MARYTNQFTASTAAQTLHQSIAQTLKACDLNLIYETSDYLVAKEKPGQVTYWRLATIEVLIDASRTSRDQTHVNLVVKNEELPLQRDNHCQRVFDTVNHAIAQVEPCQVI